MKHESNVLFLSMAVIFLLGSLCSCNYFSQKSPGHAIPHEVKQTYFIQLQWVCPVIDQLREAIKPIANKIIQEELGGEKDAALFLDKNHKALTFYYINDMDRRGEHLLISALDAMQESKKFFIPQKITLGSSVDFFGEWHDELVVMVNDSEGALAMFNKEMKIMAHALNDAYKVSGGDDLFDVSKSEQFPFVPHIGLGRIRSNSIKELVKDPAQKDKVLDRIKERTKQETLRLIDKIITRENSKISFEKIDVVIFASKRVLIKDYLLA